MKKLMFLALAGLLLAGSVQASGTQDDKKCSKECRAKCKDQKGKCNPACCHKTENKSAK